MNVPKRPMMEWVRVKVPDLNVRPAPTSSNAEARAVAVVHKGDLLHVRSRKSDSAGRGDWLLVDRYTRGELPPERRMGWVAGWLTTPLSAPWLDIMRLEEGVHEVAGSKANPRIVYFGTFVTLRPKSDEVPWCSDFANFGVQMAGGEGTKSAAARSWLHNGTRLDEPVPGCLAVLDRHSADNPEAAHVTVFLGWMEDSDRFGAFGGNQGNEACEGSYPRSRVLAWIWPS